MGQGFPQIPTRQSYGPVYQEVQPVRFPEKYIGAAETNLVTWQEHLIGTTAPSAVMIVDGTGGSWAATFVARTFDPTESLPDPAVVDLGSFQWEIQFAASVPNEAGQARRFIPRAAVASHYYATPAAQLAGAETDIVTYVTGQSVGVQFRAAGGAPIDPAGAVLQIWGST